MKREDVQIGMKVVPHNKSTGNLLGLSPVWNTAKEKNQPFLYVISIEKDFYNGEEIIILDNKKESTSGDYFKLNDIEPYVERPIWNEELFEKFKNNHNEPVVCYTEKEAREFLDELHLRNIHWYGKTINENTLFDKNKTQIVYYCNDKEYLTYTNVAYSKDNPILYKELKAVINKTLWNSFNGNETVVNCKTEEEAKALLKYCDNKGITWGNGKSLLNNTFHDCYNEETCYELNISGNMYYSPVSYYEEHGYKVITYKELFNIKEENVMKKSELKTGMMVEFRNGERDIVMLGHILRGDCLIRERGFLNISDYNDDLTKRNGNINLDIIKVYMPLVSTLSTEENKYNYSLIWERKDNSKEINELKDIIKNAQDTLIKAQNKLKELGEN